ncbi:MAG: hypothetical protein DI629_11260 [Mesorhizobium amorphae]|nr:MAG: hypothetical protein DI629_11260 [Mesorhizobium amorphae]
MGGITENIWLIIVVGGPILLAVLIAFALMRKRSISPAQRQMTERATAELYSPKDRDQPPPKH